MIEYIIRSLKNPHTGELKLYPQIAPAKTVTRRELIQNIEKVTSLSSSDVKSCLDALEFEIIRLIKSGQSVRMGDLGSFRPTLTADGTSSPEKVNANLIKRVRVRFTPSGEMARQLQPSALEFRAYKFPGAED